jgi:hypothetical protein
LLNCQPNSSALWLAPVALAERATADRSGQAFKERAQH